MSTHFLPWLLRGGEYNYNNVRRWTKPRKLVQKCGVDRVFGGRLRAVLVPVNVGQGGLTPNSCRVPGPTIDPSQSVGAAGGTSTTVPPPVADKEHRSNTDSRCDVSSRPSPRVDGAIDASTTAPLASVKQESLTPDLRRDVSSRPSPSVDGATDASTTAPLASVKQESLTPDLRRDVSDQTPPSVNAGNSPLVIDKAQKCSSLGLAPHHAASIGSEHVSDTRHWFLVAVDIAQRRIVCLDSARADADEWDPGSVQRDTALAAVTRWLGDVWADEKALGAMGGEHRERAVGEGIDGGIGGHAVEEGCVADGDSPASWVVDVDPPEAPQRDPTRDGDCGVFCCAAADWWAATGGCGTYTSGDMPTFRIRLAAVLRRHSL
jgi:hypothetical protein